MSIFRERLHKVSSHGSEKARQKHRNRGKLLARKCIHLLLDSQTLFLELSAFAAFGQYNNEIPSTGIITGIGVIKGRECMIVANNATVKGGTYVRETIKKHVRAEKIALRNNLPYIYLVDSDGIFSPKQAPVSPDRFDFGRVFFNQAQMSARGIELGLEQGAFEMAKKDAKQRKQFGKTLAEFQSISFKLADLYLKIENARNTLHNACWLKVNEHIFGKQVAISKLYCSEIAGEVATEAMQIFGGNGLFSNQEWPIERFFRDQRLLQIGEGTSEILRMLIARFYPE